MESLTKEIQTAYNLLKQIRSALDKYDVAWNDVLERLRGEDDVMIGSQLHALPYEELQKAKPDVLKHIRWDPIPSLNPIPLEQKKRVARAEEEFEEVR